MGRIIKKSSSKVPPRKDEMQKLMLEYLEGFANGKQGILRRMIDPTAALNVTGISDKFIRTRDILIENRHRDDALAKLKHEEQIKVNLTRWQFNNERNEMLVVADAKYPVEKPLRGDDLSAHMITALFNLNLPNNEIVQLDHSVTFSKSNLPS